jgi:hypothetical protein
LIASFALSGCGSNDPRYRDDTLYIGGYRGRTKEQQRANFDNVLDEVRDRLEGRPVAALRRTGSGAILFLGSPIGPALWSGDAQARAWLGSVLAAFVC